MILGALEKISNPKGEYSDQLWEKGADGSEKIVQETDWKSNTILQGMAILIIQLLKDEAVSGFQFHALGHGDSSWDTSVPPPDYTDAALFDEYYRKQPDSINYVDEDGNPVAGPTSRVLITTTFDYGEAGGSIREQGIFGGTATATLDSGTIVNAIRHKEIYKGPNRKLIRRIRFTFGV